jgi:exopolysaccharide production protein ExoY
MHNINHDFAKAQTPDATRAKVTAIASREASRSERSLIIYPSRTVQSRVGWGRELVIRAMDVCCAVVLLVLVVPVLVLIALAIVVTDNGPIVFAHSRIGRGGKPFPCYKFRTMRRDAEKQLARLLAENPGLRRQWDGDFKLEHDPRVIPFGHFLRIFSLDELPQLINVIAGDMSLVGPRPITSAEAPRYGRYIAHYLSVRPGLSGIWQVSGRNDMSYHRRVAADVFYVRNRSILLNIKILACTGSAVFDRRGAR